MVCEVCGKPSSIHLTDVVIGSSVKRQHHYCRDHAPPSVQSKLPTEEESRAHELKLLEAMIAKLDALDIDPAEKAGERAELERLAEDIRAGRRRLSDST